MFYIKRHFSYSAACFERDKGQVNWDMCFSTDFDIKPYSYGKFSLRVVMDGVSNGNGGDAAKLAFPILCHTLVGELTAISPKLDALVDEAVSEIEEDANSLKIDNILHELVLDSIHNVNSLLRDKRCETTLSVAIFFGDCLYTANIGDSPIYLIDLGEERLQLRSVFKCQTLAQEKVDCGKLSEEAALKSPLNNIITGSLGFYSDDNPSFNPLSNNNINWRRVELPLNGLLLMGSDGSLGCLTKAVMAQLVEESLPQGLVAIHETLKKHVGESGSKDDFTLIIDEFCFQ